MENQKTTRNNLQDKQKQLFERRQTGKRETRETPIGPRAPLTLRLMDGKQKEQRGQQIQLNKTNLFSNNSEQLAKQLETTFEKEDKQDKVGQVLFSWTRKVCLATGALYIKSGLTFGQIII